MLFNNSSHDITWINWVLRNELVLDGETTTYYLKYILEWIVAELYGYYSCISQ